MGGSKKGEHRGNAKKRALEGDILSPSGSASGSSGPRGPYYKRNTEEYLHQVVRYVNQTQDDAGMLPRDAIQRAQDFFYKEWKEAVGYYDWLKDLSLQPMSREDAEELEGRMQATKREARSLMAEMSNQAFKNLPYFHAKASPDQTDETNPIEIMRTLLREINDENRGRPTWMKEDPKLIESKNS